MSDTQNIKLLTNSIFSVSKICSLNPSIMNKIESLTAIERGSIVECSKEDYEREIRTAIQKQAAKWIDSGDHVRSIIALEEVRRLDNLFADK